MARWSAPSTRGSWRIASRSNRRWSVRGSIYSSSLPDSRIPGGPPRCWMRLRRPCRKPAAGMHGKQWRWLARLTTTYCWGHAPAAVDQERGGVRAAGLRAPPEPGGRAQGGAGRRRVLPALERGLPLQRHRRSREGQAAPDQAAAPHRLGSAAHPVRGGLRARPRMHGVGGVLVDRDARALRRAGLRRTSSALHRPARWSSWTSSRSPSASWCAWRPARWPSRCPSATGSTSAPSCWPCSSASASAATS